MVSLGFTQSNKNCNYVIEYVFNFFIPVLILFCFYISKSAAVTLKKASGNFRTKFVVCAILAFN